ncbi:hypothetical protein PybrP1_000670 [[Pythium] brassicae (nom. inval.)]|nr:hypothetical protein PybrP1_000670 [[Pythium] brassicae (nom. inval.)]
MIIRAVSDDEFDDEFDDAHPLRAPAAADRRLAAKLAWFGATIALAALLLADLAALLNEQPLATGARDAFALVPVWLASPSTTSAVRALFAAPATALNNVVGYVGIAAWIFSRETHMRRGGNVSRAVATASPWAASVGVLCLGHVVSCAYVLAALLESDGDRTRFFLGHARSNNSSRRHRRASPRV